MNKQDFIKLLKDPVNMSAVELKALEELVANFPYCQAAHILIAKGNSDYGSMLAQQKLKKAALYTVDRKNLKKLILRTNAYADQQGDNAATSQVPFENKEGDGASGDRDQTDPANHLTGKGKNGRGGSLIDSFLLSRSGSGTADTKDYFFEELKNKQPKISSKKTESADEQEVLKKPETTNENEYPRSNFLSSSGTDQTDNDIAQEEKKKPESELLLAYLDFLKDNRSKVRKDKHKINAIIDKFINEEPMIAPLDPTSLKGETKDLSSNNKKRQLVPLSENYALILEKQGKLEKSIEIYRELILKYPEKKAFFASRIEELTKALNK